MTYAYGFPYRSPCATPFRFNMASPHRRGSGRSGIGIECDRNETGTD
ncbi:hypothetical protein BMIN_0729 [Bifidobacterium minimum]|uniref:Uncharacterized protein n=1 Tax=Bifidobacterium minimum TaxID=1693 RepID=A0A087BPR3_9BIFI|nr:hypothetical protein BMIN_0729 [Bifidobacterium minimum]